MAWFIKREEGSLGFPIEASPVQKHAVSSFLMNNGVSAIGAQQFAAGEYVVDAQDRKMLASLMSNIVQEPGFSQFGKGTSGKLSPWKTVT